MIEPIERIDSKEILTTLKGQQIFFEFITPPQIKIINQTKENLIHKKNQLNFLKEDIKI